MLEGRIPTQVNQDVFSGGGHVATDWAQAGGNAQASIAAGAQINRGVNFNLQIQALASIDASVGKFLGAEVSGQAIAELAAAVQVGLQLKVGDFLEFAQNDPQAQGLPVELLRVFLSEVTIAAGVYAKAALTAQAYAQLVVTGTRSSSRHATSSQA